MTADHLSFVVRQWRDQFPGLDTTPLEILGRIEWIQAAADAALRPLFAEAGLGNGDFNALAALRRAGRALTPGELGAAMVVTSGAVTKRIDRLVAQGLVARVPSTSDGRGRIVSLTDEGRRLVDRLVHQHLENERRLLDGLSTAQQRRLAELLALLSDSVGRSREEPDGRLAHHGS